MSLRPAPGAPGAVLVALLCSAVVPLPVALGVRGRGLVFRGYRSVPSEASIPGSGGRPSLATKTMLFEEVDAATEGHVDRPFEQVKLVDVKALPHDSAEITLIRDAELGRANKNDLHGIRDLLLVGWTAPFAELHATRSIRNKVLELISMLQWVHPVQACRTALRDVRNQTERGEERVYAAAEAAWRCLPGAFSAEDFDRPFTEELVHAGPDKHAEGKMPQVKNEKKGLLGTCGDSPWSRACSIWVSLHLLTARAEMLGIGGTFLKLAVNIIFGGVTMCKGCQRHFRMFHEGVVEPVIEKGTLTDEGLKTWQHY